MRKRGNMTVSAQADRTSLTVFSPATTWSSGTGQGRSETAQLGTKQGGQVQVRRSSGTGQGRTEIVQKEIRDKTGRPGAGQEFRDRPGKIRGSLTEDQGQDREARSR